MECREARELFSEYLDKQLAREENLNLISHLEACPECRVELEHLGDLLTAIRSPNLIELAAPEGFASSVMARIKQEEAARAKERWKRWKQAGAAAVAALLLAAGALAIRPAVIQIAVNPDLPVIETTPAVQSAGSDSPVAPVPAESQDIEKKDPANNEPEVIADNPVKAPDTAPENNYGILTANDDHTVYSTLIKLNVDDARQAESKAKSLANSYSSSFQSLGQQSEGDAVYLMDKIVASTPDAAQALINELRNLGILTYHEKQKVYDLNEGYSQVYNQLIDLRNQRAASQDDSLKQQLDKQISKLEEQLRSWDKQSQEQTIVLWLQQK